MEQTTTKKNIRFSRVLKKISQNIARSPLAPSFFRGYIYSYMGVKLKDRKSVFFGENVYVDDIRPDLVSIGKWVRITSGVKIFTHFFDTKFIPKQDCPFRFYNGEVIIGDYVFIGANAVIAKPVTIGDWAVIGANSVITSDIPPYSIVAGSPAKVIGCRADNEGIVGFDK